MACRFFGRQIVFRCRIKAAGAHASDRVAGFRVTPNSSHQVPDDIKTDLSNWLRGKGAFNDKVVRRCARGTMVGVVLVHALPTVEETSELAIDFKCNSLVVFRARDGRNALTASFFDASREQLLTIVRRAFPADAELNRLH